MKLTVTKSLGWGLATALTVLPMTVPSAIAQDAATPRGTLTIGWQWDPGTMDAQHHRQRFTQIISQAMRDKLAIQDPPGLDTTYQLLDKATQVDATHYDIKIKEGVKFHDGTEMTSDDLVYTFQRLWDPANKSPRASMGNMTNIAGVEKVDKYTARWTTKVPFGPIDDAIEGFHFTGQEILQKAYYEKLTLDEARTAPVMGAGAFKYVEWIPDQRVVMDAFDDYWQGKPGVDRIVWRTIPEESTRVSELLAGSVDMIYPVTPDFVDQLTSAGMKLEIVPGTSTRALHMNVREGSPFHDVEVRKAMNMAIDKTAITEALYAGLAIPVEAITGPGQEGFIEGYDPFPFDPDKARAVLSKIKEPLELLTQGQWAIPAEAMAEMLRGYGMDVKTIVLETPAFNSLMEAGTFTLAFAGAGYGSGDFYGAYFNNHFECSRIETKRVRTGFCEPSLDEKIKVVRNETDPAKRAALLEEVVKLLSETYVPWVPLYDEAEVWAMKPEVHGFVGSAAGQMLNLHKITLQK